MEPITLSKLHDGAKTDCDGLFNATIQEITKRRIDQAFRHHYAINDQDAVLLQSCFPNRYILEAARGAFKETSHPILAIINDYCNASAAELIQTWKGKNKITLSIGDSADGKLKANHNCLKVDCARELHRIASNGKVDDNLRNHASRGDNTFFCVKGVENCHVQAQCAVAVHSIYDITPEEIFRAFRKHNLDTLVAYIYIPLSIYDKDLNELDTGFFNTHFIKDDVYFSMHDFATPYKHSLKNWRSWAILSKIASRDFDITIEHSRTHGPLHILNMQRVAPSSSIFPLFVPLSKLVGEYYKVPDLNHAMLNGFCLDQKDTPHHLVPRDFVDCIMRYASRVRDESYKVSEVSTVASGASRTMMYNGQVYRKSWVTSPDRYNAVVFSLFILGAISRADRTQGISKIFKELKAQLNTGIITQLCRDVSRFLTRYFSSEKETEYDQMGRLISKWSVIPINNMIYQEQLYVAVDKSPPKYSGDKLIRPDDEDATTITKDDDDSHPSGLTPIPVFDPTAPPLPGTAVPIPPLHFQAPDHDLNDRFKSVSSLNVPINGDVPDAETIEKELLLTIQENPSINPKVTTPDMPANFRAGHCAMRAFWLLLPKQSKPKQREILNLSLHLLLDCAVGNCREFARAYIFDGTWQNDCSSSIIPLLAEYYGMNITLRTTSNNVLVENKFDFSNGSKPVQYIENPTGDHFFVRAHGGAISKFKEFVDILQPLIPAGGQVIETSAAPGFFINALANKHFDNANDDDFAFYAGHFKEGSPFTQCQDDINIQRYTGSISNLFPKKKFHMIISDAARSINSEALTNDAVDFIKERLFVGGHAFIKTFGNPFTTFELATHFRNYQAHPGVSSEVYYLLLDYQPDQPIFRPFDAVYDANVQPITNHCLPFDKFKICRFHDYYFKGMSKFQPSLPASFTRVKVDFFSILVNTGYASSAKTTEMIKKMPNACYIAPTQELSRRHQQLGVKSFTPHVAFGSIHDGDIIIVDEISQFCVEYFALLHVVFPTSKIIAMGDIYQTPFTNLFDPKFRYNNIQDYGLVNNLIDVYAIPQDITKALNKKFGWFIRSKSNVQVAVSKLPPSFEIHKNKNVQTICLNSATQVNLSSKGVKCNTITTYTGSRSPDVVLYIDGAAIASNIINQTAFIYTAVTRATSRLFLAGDTECIERYFNFENTQIHTYSEYSQIFYHDEVFVNSEITLELTQDDNDVADDVGTQAIAEGLIQDTVQPINEETNTSSYINYQNVEIGKSSKLNAPTDALLALDHTDTVFRVSSEINAVLNQVSNSSLQTVRTLAGRYGTEYQVQSKKEEHFAYTQLYNGLLKSLYGNSFSSRKLKKDLAASRAEVLRHAYDYLESLGHKIGENTGLIKELDEMFDTDQDGHLAFFNKRQSKWKPADGFDASDKVGQGVASFGKKVNILFSAFSRFLLTRVQEILVKNNRNIHLATHKSEAGINDIYCSMLEKNKNPITNWTCNDFSQWDASFRRCFIQLTSTLLGYIGVDPALIAWFASVRDNWKMVYKGPFGNTTLRGSEKQFSGNPFTICENTIGNMSLCFAIFEFSGFQLALFKGDDAAIACRKCDMTESGKRVIRYTGHGLKLHNSPIGEFAGWFLCNKGIFPDTLRYAAKFLCKNYRDEDHFNEALMSLQERCSAVKHQSQLNEGCIVSSLYYNQTIPGAKLTPDAVSSLFYFLKKSRSITFTDLKQIDLQVANI